MLFSLASVKYQLMLTPAPAPKSVLTCAVVQSCGRPLAKLTRKSRVTAQDSMPSFSVPLVALAQGTEGLWAVLASVWLLVLPMPLACVDMPCGLGLTSLAVSAGPGCRLGLAAGGGLATAWRARACICIMRIALGSNIMGRCAGHVPARTEAQTEHADMRDASSQDAACPHLAAAGGSKHGPGRLSRWHSRVDAPSPMAPCRGTRQST
jgi:hypothetical protein